MPLTSGNVLGRGSPGHAWDTVRKREDLSETDIAVLEHQFPGVAARLAAQARPEEGQGAGGVQSPHPRYGCG